MGKALRVQSAPLEQTICELATSRKFYLCFDVGRHEELPLRHHVIATRTNGFAGTGPPMLFWLPMIFMSAIVELTIPTFPDAVKAAPVPLKSKN